MAKTAPAGSGLPASTPSIGTLMASDPAVAAFGGTSKKLEQFYSSAYGNPETIRQALKIAGDDADVRGVFSALNSPYANNPNPVSGRFATQKTIFDSLSGWAPIDQDDSRYSDQARAAKGLESLESPVTGAALSDIPTSTTNYLRPRTIAAGWDPASETLTVVFRDGTFWNYYNVPADVWISFHNRFSKGPMLNRANSNQASDGVLLGYQNGPADVSALDPQVRQLVWQAARAAQIYRKDTSKGYASVRRVTTTAGSRAIKVKTKKQITTYGTSASPKMPRKRNLSKAYSTQQAVQAMNTAGKNPAFKRKK